MFLAPELELCRICILMLSGCELTVSYCFRIRSLTLIVAQQLAGVPSMSKHVSFHLLGVVACCPTCFASKSNHTSISLRSLKHFPGPYTRKPTRRQHTRALVPWKSESPCLRALQEGTLAVPWLRFASLETQDCCTVLCGEVELRAQLHVIYTTVYSSVGVRY